MTWLPVFLKERWYLRVTVIFSLNLMLFLFISFPNPVLFIDQLNRQHQGIDSMVVVDNPVFIEFAEEAYNFSRENPETYIHKSIREMHDYEIYWNVEYWAYPHETVERGAGDCEDLAVLTKAVHRYVKENYVEEEHVEEYVEEFVKQAAHVYVVRNYTGVNETEVHGWKMTDEAVGRYYSVLGRIQSYLGFMPAWRWLLYLCLAVSLNYGFYRWVRS